MRASKRLLFIILIPVFFLLIASLLAVWFYRPTTATAAPEWAATQTGAPTLATGRRPATYNMLLVGRDRASASTDVMALVSFDTAEKKMTVFICHIYGFS